MRSKLLRTAWTVLYIVKLRICSKCGDEMHLLRPRPLVDWKSPNPSCHLWLNSQACQSKPVYQHSTMTESLTTQLGHKKCSYAAISYFWQTKDIYVVTFAIILNTAAIPKSPPPITETLTSWSSRCPPIRATADQLWFEFIKAVLYMHSGTFSCLTFVKGEIWHVG